MKQSQNIVGQLKIIFSISIFLLLASLIGSIYSTRQLIKNTELVNHTNEVLLIAESVISTLKDAETGQRGYLLTQDPSFLGPYEGAYTKTSELYNKLLTLTIDNPVQQKNLTPMKERFEARFAQMQRIIDLTKRDAVIQMNQETMRREMNLGKKIMDDLRLIVNEVKAEETRIYELRSAEQQAYSAYTPYFLVIAALISISITVFAFLRIRSDIDQRIRKEQEAEVLYNQTKNRITKIEGVTRQIASGQYSARSDDTLDDELGRISIALNQMSAALFKSFSDLESKNWLQKGSINIADAMRGERIIEKLTANILQSLTIYLKAPVATFYVVDNEYSYRLQASIASSHAPSLIRPGDGLIGQAIHSKEMLVVNDLPEAYLPVSSSLGSGNPHSVVIIPLVYAFECLGIVEIGFLTPPGDQELNFLTANREAMAVAINAALDYSKLQNFLEETQAQAEELQAQHNELENLNEELEIQAQKLQASEEELRVQQEELQQTNGELEERSSLLEERNMEILAKAKELEVSTRYKSEFLANMSHELRTPLNSILLLSRLLKENTDENLSADQVEYASVINSSGNGLLALIDEILDLSKIEAGKMELDYAQVSLKALSQDLTSLFKPIAKEKNIEFEVTLDETLPENIETDKMRLEQILKNLISNAVKFTAKGTVNLIVRKNRRDSGVVEFVVKDTGIGIAPDKQKLIFEAFQQADGSTKRKYGGTGLGLSISRELAKLLGGSIDVTSEVHQGSEFSISIPAARPSDRYMGIDASLSANITVSAPEVLDQYISTTIPESVPDDRTNISVGDKTILIVEDDIPFAKSLLEYTRKKGYKGIVSVRGDEGLQLAQDFLPTGILLDLQLPVISGWQIMDALKQNPETRHIPVHVMSSYKMKTESLLKGAVDFIDKPMAIDRLADIFNKIEYVISRKSKKVLIVEDNHKHAQALASFLETFSINSDLKNNIAEGLEALQNNEVDCVILDMGVPDQKAYETLEEVKKNPDFEHIPIIIFTGKSLSINEEHRIKQYADSIILKTAHSYQRMLDEVSLFLHLVEENKKAENKPSYSRTLTGFAEILNNKTVLIADDDVRNIFSLTKSLENFKMNVITALDGKEAMAKLADNPSIDVVLLDMMMPQMDGYETARRIRANPRWKDLPVIAVTAKAMTGDREKCINAGASDYITKPVDVDQLVSLLRVWLYDKG